MDTYKRIARSYWLIVVLLVLSFAVSTPRYFQTTFDTPRYEYYPPFGTTQTATGLGEDFSRQGRIDPFGAFKVAGGFLVLPVLFFIFTFIPLLAIRGLLRVSEQSSRQIIISVSNILLSLLTIYFALVVLFSFWTLFQIGVAYLRPGM